MAKKIMAISRAVPGAERKRTSEKAPATATPAPTLPLTSRITSATEGGSRARVTKKLLDERERTKQSDEKRMPQSSAAPRQRKKAAGVAEPFANRL